MPLAGRTVFQMDQAAPSDQSVFWHIRERRQNTDMDCGISLCAGGYHKKASQTGIEPLHNSTDFERNAFRESLYFTSTYGKQL